jgi:LacI family transcriptional regulator
MKLTLHEVARRAGVSTKTVSRVVNHQGEISDETRARVQAVINEMGYRPNILARSLVNRRSNSLGVVAWGLDYFAPSQIVVGIEKKARELGYTLLLQLIADPADPSALQMLEILAAYRVDGIIWAIPEVGENRAWLDTQLRKSLPPILFMNMETRSGVASVSIDNWAGGMSAGLHLIQSGRKHLSLISGPLDWWEARQRSEGWRAALCQAGMEATPSQIVEATWSVASGERAMRSLLECFPNVDAVFACSDDIALGALATLYRSGRKVPDDVAVVGFDNIPQSAYFHPPLTTVDQPLAEIGRMAVEKLHEQIVQPSESEENLYGEIKVPKLIVRASST